MDPGSVRGVLGTPESKLLLAFLGDDGELSEGEASAYGRRFPGEARGARMHLERLKQTPEFQAVSAYHAERRRAEALRSELRAIKSLYPLDEGRAYARNLTLSRACAVWKVVADDSEIPDRVLNLASPDPQ
jgi:hypothetical protein